MRKVLGIVSVLVVLTVPAMAGEFDLYGSVWDASDADNVAGGGFGFAWPLGSVLDFSVRASFYRELESDALEIIDDLENPIEPGIKAYPVEVGLRFNFARDSEFWNPWIGAGGAYFALDTSDDGNIDDEVGFYAEFGSTFGDGEGVDFYADFTYRIVEGTITDLDLDDDEDFDDEADIKLDGPVANVGIAWKW